LEVPRIRRAQRDGSDASLQQVDESDLSEFDKDRSDYLRRLEVDASIVNELRGEGFEGPKYEYFANELAKYGIAVIRAWVRQGVIFAKVRSKGFGGLAEAPRQILRDKDTAEELALLCVADALRTFRIYVLLPNKWDPKKGASIRTYFIGQCLIRFPNIYRKWLSETVDTVPAVVVAQEQYRLTDRGGSIEQSVQIRAEVETVLAKIGKPRTQEIFVLFGAGYTQGEIAATLNVSVKTVEMAIANERKRQQKRRNVG
jgi:DNA-directed RNA polymerase specialized sigma24 family protein